jgi:hypothetical protein
LRAGRLGRKTSVDGNDMTETSRFDSQASEVVDDLLPLGFECYDNDRTVELYFVDWAYVLKITIRWTRFIFGIAINALIDPFESIDSVANVDESGSIFGLDRKLSAKMQRRVGPPVLQPFHSRLAVIKAYDRIASRTIKF